ncbi:MAG: DUF262 domain-containing protein, partial [Nanoarchaeota archaeon]
LLALKKGKLFYIDYILKFILRPPYQRHSGVWTNKMKEQLLDSVCRHYYIPKLVLRKIRIDKDNIKWEVIDGQQRISTFLEFFDENSNLKLPDSLKDLHPDLPGKKYSDLSPDKRQWFSKLLYIKADLITQLEDKGDPENLKIVADLFWRLQQGEPLTFMESLHSKLYSNVRNFVSKYADTFSFNFELYEALNSNPDIHKFFSKILDIKNERMEYLQLLSRFLMIEFENGPTEVGKDKTIEFFEKYPLCTKNIIDPEFEKKKEVKSCISNLNTFYEIYKDNKMIDEKNGVKYLRKDYYIISLYLLLRYLKNNYVFDQEEYKLFDKFSSEFYIRLTKNDQEDLEILRFRENRQQSKENLEIRDRIIRKAFFEENKDLKLKDSKRNFDEPQKIQIYNRDKGLCQECLKEGRNEEESRVSWSQYDADHITAHIKGGKTDISQGQVLCTHHNRSKGKN